MLTVLTDGSGGTVGGGTLIGAGFSGLTYSTLAGKHYNWKDFGIQEAVGAVGGLVAGYFGAAGGAAADLASSFGGKIAIQALFTGAGGFTRPWRVRRSVWPCTAGARVPSSAPAESSAARASTVILSAPP